MSRYIRTKEGKIFDLESKEISSIEYIDKNTAINEYKVECAFYTIYYYNGLKGHYLECDNKGGYSCDFIEEKDILKQADTIEELCDEIIKKEPNHKHPEWLIGDVMNYLRNESFMKIMTTRIKNGTLKIFVGIWVDDNFIKVAELNEKGELELI